MFEQRVFWIDYQGKQVDLYRTNVLIHFIVRRWEKATDLARGFGFIKYRIGNVAGFISDRGNRRF